MDLQLAEQQVKKWAEANSYSLGLNDSKIEAKYIWNPGGFVNQSYRISDGETIRHVKIAPEQREATEELAFFFGGGANSVKRRHSLRVLEMNVFFLSS